MPTSPQCQTEPTVVRAKGGSVHHLKTHFPPAAARAVAFNSTKAGEGNRTLTASLEGWCSAFELHPRATHGGQRIRTSVGVSRQIYSLLPLTTRAALQGMGLRRNRGGARTRSAKLTVRIELTTCGLQNRCSAVELRQPKRPSSLRLRYQRTCADQGQLGRRTPAVPSTRRTRSNRGGSPALGVSTGPALVSRPIPKNP